MCCCYQKQRRSYRRIYSLDIMCSYTATYVVCYVHESNTYMFTFSLVLVIIFAKCMGAQILLNGAVYFGVTILSMRRLAVSY